MLTDIIGEAKMANAIVQEVLDFVRPIRLQVEPTQLCDAVQAAVQHADAKGRRGNIEVETRVPPTLPLHPGGQASAHTGPHEPDRQRLRGSRWRGARGGDGRARPACRTAAADATPSWWKSRTTARGFPRTCVRRSSTVFFTTKPQGSGLGLAIVKRIVDAHDGRLDLQTSSEGTRVRVTLPLAGIEDATVSTSAHACGERPGTGKRNH